MTLCCPPRQLESWAVVLSGYGGWLIVGISRPCAARVDCASSVAKLLSGGQPPSGRKTAMDSPGPCVLMRVPEAAQLAGVTPRVLYQWIERGVLPEAVVLRAGRAIYLKRGPLVAWLDGGRASQDFMVPGS